MMLVTIMTDASHDPESKAGRYGYWIASQRGKRAGGGALKGEVIGAFQAEMMAVVNALHVGFRCGLICEGDVVLVQTDCTAAIHALRRGWTRKKSDQTRDIIRAFNALTNKVGVRFKHVKGHSKVQDARSKANRHCDARAYAGMKRAKGEATT